MTGIVVDRCIETKTPLFVSLYSFHSTQDTIVCFSTQLDGYNNIHFILLSGIVTQSFRALLHPPDTTNI